MARASTVEWSPGREVPTLTEGSGEVAILLAHGAGVGQDHPFMAGMRSRLAAAGLATTTFDYPYVAEGRRRPDRPDTLLECHRAVLASLDAGRIVLGGKSMGGRMSSHLDEPAAGRFFLGYPLVPIGKSEPRDTSHLEGIAEPLLFVQGARDRMAPLDLITPLVEALPRATLEVIADAGHSFEVPKRTGLDKEGILDGLAGIVTGWAASVLG